MFTSELKHYYTQVVNTQEASYRATSFSQIWRVVDEFKKLNAPLLHFVSVFGARAEVYHDMVGLERLAGPPAGVYYWRRYQLRESMTNIKN